MSSAPELIIFDVGHGSCVFLQDGTSTTVIDCKNSTLFIDFLLSRNISSISQVIISHADADHIDGVLALIQSDYITLGTVFINPDASKESEAWRDLRIGLQDAWRRGKLKVRTGIGEGMADELAQENVRIEVLAPRIASGLAGPGGRTPQGDRASSNAMSVVLRLHHEDYPVTLVAGDLDQVGLDDLIAGGKPLDSDILLFPHHGGHIGHGGSETQRARDNVAFTGKIMEQVRPKVVLFSIGRGIFSTPRPEIVQEIRARGADCYIRCTQLSEYCERQNSERPTSHLASLPALGRNKNRCCGGSVSIMLAGRKTVARLDRRPHLRFVTDEVSTPMCTGHARGT